ncbi:hypothetical protein ACNKHQ_21050 [Shigella flexneri]
MAREALGDEIPLAVISGPTLPKTGCRYANGNCAGGDDPVFADDLPQLLHCVRASASTATQIIGVQLGGAVKNMIAIGAGISDGIGFGANARTALITRGLTEMSRLGVALALIPVDLYGYGGGSAI